MLYTAAAVGGKCASEEINGEGQGALPIGKKGASMKSSRATGKAKSKQSPQADVEAAGTLGKENAGGTQQQCKGQARGVKKGASKCKSVIAAQEEAQTAADCTTKGAHLDQQQQSAQAGKAGAVKTCSKSAAQGKTRHSPGKAASARSNKRHADNVPKDRQGRAVTRGSKQRGVGEPENGSRAASTSAGSIAYAALINEHNVFDLEHPLWQDIECWCITCVMPQPSPTCFHGCCCCSTRTAIFAAATGACS